MLRRFGFRRILPLFQLVLFFVLLTIGFNHQRRAIEGTQPRLKPIALQENMSGWHPDVRPQIPVPWKAAIAINVPAAILGAMVAALTVKTGSDLYVLLFSVPFVPLLWLLIGRWLDYQLRLLPRPPRSIPRIIFDCLGIFIALFGAYAAGLSYYHQGPTGTMLMTGSWSLFLLVMCMTALFRRPPLLQSA